MKDFYRIKYISEERYIETKKTFFFFSKYKKTSKIEKTLHCIFYKRQQVTSGKVYR